MVSKVKLTLLTITIAIIFALFVGYGIHTFYKEPSFDDFCERENYNIQNKAECEAAGGEWNPSPKLADARDNKLTCDIISTNEDNLTLDCIRNNETEDRGYCDAQAGCREEYNEARNNYNRNVFIVTVVIGLIALLTGGILLKAESVGIGLMGGSILTMLYGILRYWGEAPDILRFSLLGVVLAVLIWLGYKKLTPK